MTRPRALFAAILLLALLAVALLGLRDPGPACDRVEISVLRPDGGETTEVVRACYPDAGHLK